MVVPATLDAKILDALPEGVAVLRLDGCIEIANRAIANLLHCQPAELVGADIATRFVGLDGELLDELTDVECELQAFDGTRAPVSLSSTVLRDLSDSLRGIVLVTRDLREVVALRGHLVVSGRLAAIGELAAGIAHEISNPLTYVRANLGMLRKHWEAIGSEMLKRGASEPFQDLIAEGEEMIDESLQGVDRACAIVRDVRGLAHAGCGERKMANLNDLLEGVLRVAAPQLSKTATVEKRFGSLPLIPCVPQELQQVFLNLVLNASQAIEAYGNICIRTEADDGKVVVWIDDDGCGISPEVVERIFDPFFTTKSIGEGTGLGLGITHQIVRRHRGQISVDSILGRGASFCVSFPISPEPHESGV